MPRHWNRSLLPLLLAVFLPVMALAQISVEVSANVAPPELPVYDQPPMPADGYVWTPGYWAWSDGDQDYYWVPGTWVAAPQPEYLWTPGYWGMQGAVFLWHPGYWGSQVGFYGGVNYGYGYGGVGYEGGYWQGGHLFYNRGVNNFGTVNVTNVYNRTVVNNVNVTHVSYNGGNGIQAQPTPAQLAAARGPHIEATSAQRQQMTMAQSQPTLRASQNHGHPPIAATARPGAFSGAGVTGARPAGPATVAHQNPAQNPAPHANPPAPPARAMTAPPPAAPHPAAPPPATPPPAAPHPAAPPPAAAPHAETPPPPAEPRHAPETHAAPPRPAEHPPEREPPHDH
jgi:hypothetical protein